MCSQGAVTSRRGNGSVGTLRPDALGQTNYCLSIGKLEAWDIEKERGGFCAEDFIYLREACL